MSKLPRTKPPVVGFFLDDEANIWVSLERTKDAMSPMYDVFDRNGRFLGTARSAFEILREPIVRNGIIYGVTRDTLEVQYVVRGRIVKPVAN